VNTNVNLSAAPGAPGFLGAYFVFDTSEEGRRALSTEGGVGMPLDTPLRPGESYTMEPVFDLPTDARDPVLLLNGSSPEARFIIGHEDSPLHGKTEFKL
jgi:hypothetical protein